MTARSFFRAMLADGDDGPTIGDRSNMLGIRPGIDVKTPTAGPGCGGMSVTADDPTRMHVGVLPEAFGGLNREAVVFETLQATFGHGAARYPIPPWAASRAG